MYKDIIRKIYKNVKNEKNEEKNPCINDYVRAIIKHEDEQFFKNNNEAAIKNKIEKMRRTVAHALDVLEAEQVLGKIGKSYVPIEKALKHQGYLYLLENLHPEKDHVIKIYDKLYMIPIERKKVKKQNLELCPQAVDEAEDEIAKLQLEVEFLKERLETLTQKRNETGKIIDSIKKFIGYENCGSVFTSNYNIIIILDSVNDFSGVRIY